MHTTALEAALLAKGLVDASGNVDDIKVIVCPPFPHLSLVRDILKGSNIALGAQNMYPGVNGAFTGEVSPTMLIDLGCSYVILGHSERRHLLGESDHFVNQKVVCALASGLKIILCVGETLEQRTSRQTEAVLNRQLCKSLAGVASEQLSRLSIAYEPVWAIGNSEHHATPKQGHDAQVLIRKQVAETYGDDWAKQIIIQYGGSVVPENAAAFLAQPGIDGVLIGGASLSAQEFVAIIGAAQSETAAQL